MTATVSREAINRQLETAQHGIDQMQRCKTRSAWDAAYEIASKALSQAVVLTEQWTKEEDYPAGDES